jgi:hypothetical protein
MFCFRSIGVIFKHKLLSIQITPATIFYSLPIFKVSGLLKLFYRSLFFAFGFLYLIIF